MGKASLRSGNRALPWKRVFVLAIWRCSQDRPRASHSCENMLPCALGPNLPRREGMYPAVLMSFYCQGYLGLTFSTFQR